MLVFFQNYLYSQSTTIDSLVIYDTILNSNTSGKADFILGVDSYVKQRDWILDLGDCIEMAYQGILGWGAVFITIGEPYEDRKKNKRKDDDYSMYNFFSVDLKGKEGKEFIEIALKDKLDLNDGSETKIPIIVTKNWNSYEIPLNDFVTADLQTLHVVATFVFRGQDDRTIYFRNIKFLKKKINTESKSSINKN